MEFYYWLSYLAIIFMTSVLWNVSNKNKTITELLFYSDTLITDDCWAVDCWTLRNGDARNANDIEEFLFESCNLRQLNPRTTTVNIVYVRLLLVDKSKSWLFACHQNIVYKTRVPSNELPITSYLHVCTLDKDDHPYNSSPPWMYTKTHSG